MQEMNKQFVDMCKDVINLNTETLKEVTSSKHFKELMDAQRPDELASAYIKLAVEANQKAVDYMQKATKIMLEFTSGLNKNVTNIAGDMAKRTREAAGAAASHRK